MHRMDSRLRHPRESIQGLSHYQKYARAYEPRAHSYRIHLYRKSKNSTHTPPFENEPEANDENESVYGSDDGGYTNHPESTAASRTLVQPLPKFLR